ncbi:MAG: sugar isomerase [Micrococcaceae bacterium]|nr:sugar isomerase [Micrococcaceae bacterium]
MTTNASLGQHMDEELRSQPDVWQRAVTQAGSENLLPASGARVAVVGCGTSWFMAESYAAARETVGHAVAGGLPGRGYDAVVAITRSGTTSEVLTLLKELEPGITTIALVGDTSSPIVEMVDRVVELPYADEQSVVQTRFATTALAYLLSSVGMDLGEAIEQARTAVDQETGTDLLEAEQFTFLGQGWSVGLAHEAALKMREAVQGWTEAYPAMDYRHGPIAIAAPGRVTWSFGPAPEGLAADVERTGALYVESSRHPLAELARLHRVTLDRARHRGLDPDAPRNLSRSVILEEQA